MKVSYGQCQFLLVGKSCDLAVCLNGKSYLVGGIPIEDHDDAYAKDDICEAVRKAKF